MVVAKQIKKNITFNDAINDFKSLKEYEYNGKRPHRYQRVITSRLHQLGD
jgi:hypothetical protein